MSLSHLLRAGQRTLSMMLPEINRQLFSRNSFHTMSRDWKMTPQLLAVPRTSIVTSVRGMKSKGRLQLRCRDCYMVVRQGVWYVMCKTFPRHKQQKIPKKEKTTWILTHATQHKIRPW